MTKRNINTKINQEHFEKLVERAKENDTTVSHEVRKIIKKEFDSQ